MDNIIQEPNENMLSQNTNSTVIKENFIRAGKAVLVAAALVSAAAGGFIYAQKIRPHETTPVERLPIISQEARADYESGKIAKATAEKMISAQLDNLKDMEEIQDWEYYEGFGKYEITLSNGTLFSYYLK